MQLSVEALGILPLLLICRQSVLPEDHVVCHRQGKQRRGPRRNLAPSLVTSLIQTYDRALFLCLSAVIVRMSHIIQYKLPTPHRQGEIPTSREDVPDSYRLLAPSQHSLHNRPKIITAK